MKKVYRSYAKVNIFLKIVGAREEYHEIVSRFVLLDKLYPGGQYGHPTPTTVVPSVSKMQTDGNLVLYAANWKAAWATNKDGNGASFARLQTDGNFVSYTSSWKPTWFTGTASR